MAKEYKELCRVTISEANNGFTVSKYTDQGESVEVATSWDEASEAARKMLMGNKRKKS